jgi:hypothetical protein
MLISGNNNLSRLKSCLDTAHNFLLSEAQSNGTGMACVKKLNSAKLARNCYVVDKFLNSFSMQ